MKSKVSVVTGLKNAGGWFVITNLMRLGAGWWVTRYLAPADFSLLATVFAIQGLALGLMAFTMFSELVRTEAVSEEDLRVAWSWEFVRNAGIWLVLFAAAPMAAEWMGRSDVVMALRVSITMLVISALNSPRLVELRRRGSFGVLGMLDGINGLCYAGTAVVGTLLFQNYWALIIAGLISAGGYAIASYFIVPWLPSFSFDLKRARPMIAFGLVLLLATGVAAIREHGMVFLIAGKGEPSDLGYYNRALTFSYSLSVMAGSLFWRVAYPVYAQTHVAGGNVFKEAAKTQLLLLCAGLPAVALSALFSESWISWVFGTKWGGMAPTWCWLALAGALGLAGAPYEVAFQATRHERLSLAILGGCTVAQLGLAWLLLPRYGIAAAGVAMVCGVLLSLVVFRIVAGIWLTGEKKGAGPADATCQLGRV